MIVRQHVRQHVRLQDGHAELRVRLEDARPVGKGSGYEVLCILVSQKLHVILWVRGDAAVGPATGVVVESCGPILYHGTLIIGDTGGGAEKWLRKYCMSR